MMAVKYSQYMSTFDSVCTRVQNCNLFISRKEKETNEVYLNIIDPKDELSMLRH
jgi:hypothetical protein